jgi:hypothetical protein
MFSAGDSRVWGSDGGGRLMTWRLKHMNWWVGLMDERQGMWKASVETDKFQWNLETATGETWVHDAQRTMSETGNQRVVSLLSSGAQTI